MVKMNKEEFKESLKKIGINPTNEQLVKLEIYKNTLIEYNEHTNLTAIKEENAIYLKHFYDSLTLNKYLKENDKVLDIGTGAGFPGMVLAIFNPKINFVLLDSNNKKIKFLEYLNQKLNLNNIELVNDRAENYIKNNFEKFDVVTSRAVAELRILLELGIPALKINGIFIAMKANVNDELKKSYDTIEILNGKIIKEENILLPIENSKRTILIIEHTKKTDSIYPRNYDKILKKPLAKKR
jgi:16S rRNA (guanine527-N7)-methyltransferase